MTTRNRISLLPWLLGVVLALAWPAAAQTGAIEGDVRDMDGKPLADVTIQIVRTDINMRFETKTDKKGYYVYMGLPAGNARYTVSAVREGKVLFQLRDIRLPAGEFHRVDIDLKKEQELQKTQLTEEQKKQLEEMRQQQERNKSLRENFDLGIQLLREPSAQVVCAARCPPDQADRESCLAACQGQPEPELKQLAYLQAAAAFERAAEADPSQYAVWANLGRAYQMANQSDKGIEAYRKAIELKPDEAGAHNNLGQLYVQAGRLEEAQKEFETAAQLNPTEAGAYFYNLGVTFYNAGNLKAAIDPLRKATEIDPKRADSYYLLGMCLFNQAEYKQEGDKLVTVLQPGTREAFEQYLALDPNGKFAADAKTMLEAIEQTVPASVRVKKK